MFKLGARELRTTLPNKADIVKIRRNPIYIVLDNVLDTYNVGSIFRLADAVSAEKVYLCGQTLTPPNSRIKKASINTWQWIPWEYAETAVQAIRQLKKKWEMGNGKLESDMGGEKQSGKSHFSLRNPVSHFSVHPSVYIVAVEQHPKSIPYTQMKVEFPLAVVVGNETDGVSKEVLGMADQIVEIPMWGVNKSLNVMVSLAVVLFRIMEKSSP